MALGTDGEICKTELKEAMRALVGDNVDRKDVDPNFGALGNGVYSILVSHAETGTAAAQDPAYWKWVADVNAWLTALSSWQQGVMAAVNTWAPTLPAEQALKAALMALSKPGAPPVSAPVKLQGKIL